MYVQLLELWPMAKLVVKQSAKAHGPLVDIFEADIALARQSLGLKSNYPIYYFATL